MTWKRFSDALKQKPYLQVLCLSDTLPTGLGRPVSWTPTYLASLQKLFIRCRATQAEALFSCIAFPLTTMLKIECPMPSSTDGNLADLLVDIGQLYSNKLDTYFQSIILLEINPSDTPDGLALKLFMNALEDEQMLDHNISASLECRFTWGRSHDALEIFTNTMNVIFSCGIPLQDISRVYLTETLSVLKPDILANTVGKLNQVRSIVTSKHAGRLLVDAIEFGGYNEDISSAIPTKSPYFPNLSAICLHWARFRAPYNQQIREDDPAYLPVEQLNNCLVQRSRFGMGLTKLAFRRCRRVLKADVVLFRKVVDDVDWDGSRLK